MGTGLFNGQLWKGKHPKQFELCPQTWVVAVLSLGRYLQTQLYFGGFPPAQQRQKAAHQFTGNNHGSTCHTGGEDQQLDRSRLPVFSI